MGLTIGLFAVPTGASKRRRIGTLAAIVILANVPDLKFPGWGHDRYDISHSVFSIGLISLMFVAVPFLSRRVRGWSGGMKVVLLGVVAMFSHLLLDSTYNHGKGIGLFWPLSEARMNLALPWFETLKTNLPTITSHSLRVMGIELAIYGAIFVIALLSRRAWINRSLSGEKARIA